MKVNELREYLQKSHPDLVMMICAECYKQVPKGKKEELDSLIMDMLEGRLDKKERKAREQADVNYEELEFEIEEFLKNAYEQNYWIPNRVVPKKQRAKWRFLVKRYIKELDAVEEDDEFSGKAAKLLLKICQMLYYACRCQIFSSDNPFGSIQMESEEVMDIVMKHVFMQEVDMETMLEIVKMVVLDSASMCWNVDSNVELLEKRLDTASKRELAVQAAKTLLEKQKELMERKSDRISEYELKENIKNLNKTIFEIAAMMGTTELEMSDYLNCYEEREKSSAFDYGLRTIYDLGTKEAWIKFYEFGIGQHIEAYDEMVKTYEEFKAEGL